MSPWPSLPPFLMESSVVTESGIQSIFCPAGLFGRTTIAQIAAFSLGRTDRLHGPSRAMFGTRGASLWCGAPDVSAPSDSASAASSPPVLWTGLIHSVLEALDPCARNQRISTGVWFVISQVGFGIVAGIVVSKQERIRTWQFLPFAVRVGMEAPGAIDEKNGERH